MERKVRCGFALIRGTGLISKSCFARWNEACGPRFRRSKLPQPVLCLSRIKLRHDKLHSQEFQASVVPPLGGMGQGSGEPSATSVPPLGGIGQGRGEPSATKKLEMAAGGLGGIGQGRGEPSATNAPPLGGMGQGKGEPSATIGLLTLYLPLPRPGSRMKTARSSIADRTTNFFMDEPSWLRTMRAPRTTWGQNSKMF